MKESKRLLIIDSVLNKQRTQKEASAILGLSVRQVKRLCSALKKEGTQGLLSKRRGHISQRRISNEEECYFIDLVRRNYPDFGPQLAKEYLSTSHGYTRSVETLRGWMIKAGLWYGKHKRIVQHPPRARRSCRGELVQIDGSLHDWFEGRKGAKPCSLLAFIDDASSEVLFARFFPYETSLGYLKVLQDYIHKHGIPLALYSDKHSIFTKHNKEDMQPTQFGRALESLGIEGICANTPQAKGRVERLFLTLQDRLVKAMRLEGIDDMQTANDWLDGYLLQHNSRFAQIAKNAEDAHIRCVLSARQLALVCSIQEKRILRNLTCSFKGQKYVIQTGGSPRYALNKKTISVCTTTENEIVLLNGDEELRYQVFSKGQYKEKEIDAKLLNARVDEIVRVRKQAKTKYIPAATHPWRRMPI